MRRVVYLSGALAGHTYQQAKTDHDKAASLLLARGWDILDPLRGREILSTLQQPMDGPETVALLGVTDAALIQRDEDDVHRADVVLILTGDYPSWGTAMEWAEAAILYHKPVVVVGTKYKDHPWCKHYASYFAETVEDAINFLDSFLDRGYRLAEEKSDGRKENSWT